MSKFELSQKFRASKPISAETIKNYLKERLTKTCTYSLSSENSNTFSAKGRVIESVFTPMTKFEATFTIKVDGENVRIIVDGESTTNWVFWLFFIVGLFTGIFLIIGLVLYYIQKEKPKEACDAIIKAVDTEFGVI